MRLARWAFWLALVGLMVGALKPGETPEGLRDLVLREWPDASPAVAQKAAAVSGCEAGHRAYVVGDSTLMDAKWGPSLGAFQIRTLWKHLPHFGRFVDGKPNRNPLVVWIPSFNAQAAYDISGGGKNWSPWTCGRAS